MNRFTEHQLEILRDLVSLELEADHDGDTKYEDELNEIMEILCS